MVARTVNDAVAQATRQQQRAADPNGSAWVAANAGSGKTTVLANRVLALLLTGAKPERILCLTYTKAATAEMRIRIERTLAGWSIAGDAELAEEIRPDRPAPAFVRAVGPCTATVRPDNRFAHRRSGSTPSTPSAKGCWDDFRWRPKWPPTSWLRTTGSSSSSSIRRATPSCGAGMPARGMAIEVVADHLPDTALDQFLSDLLSRRDRMGPEAAGQLRSVLAVPEVPPAAPGRREARRNPARER